MQSKWSLALLVIAGVVLLSGIGFASACPSTTYDQYLGSGFSCGINDKTFANFSYTDTSNPPGFGIPAGSVFVTPITTPGNPGFAFSAGWFASTDSGIMEEDSLLGFSVNVNRGGNPITDISLSIAGAGITGTGSVFVDETVCLGAMLPSCSGGQVVTLAVFDSSSGSHLFDEVSFAGVTEVDVAKDVLIEAGTNGSARLSLMTEQFSEGTTPEPGSILLFGSGVLALAGVLRRKLHP